MKIAKNKDERRNQLRYSIAGEIPAQFFVQGQPEPLEYVFVDVSSRGLGVMLSPAPPLDSIVELKLEKSTQVLAFHVRYVKTESAFLGTDLESMRRCGCELHESQHDQIDLVKFFGQFSTIIVGE